MEACDFVQDKLTEWDLSELIQRFEGKIYLTVLLWWAHALYWHELSLFSLVFFVFLLNTTPIQYPWCEFHLNVCFPFLLLLDQGIDKETFLSLEESGNLNDLIPRTGPRVKFRKRLREYLQVTCFWILYVLYIYIIQSTQQSHFKLQVRDLPYQYCACAPLNKRNKNEWDVSILS